MVSEEKIRENLINGEDVNWDYLKKLRDGDKVRVTENYQRAISSVLDNVLVTTASLEAGNYFVHIPGLGRSVPIIHRSLRYFPKHEDADSFRKVLYPKGIIAKIL